MKKYIIIISAIFFVQLSAQTFQDFAPTGASWWYSMHDLGYTYELAGVDLLHIESIGDTLIGGRECKILHKQYYEKEEMKDTRLDFCYSEAGKVYYWISEEWRLLYDYSAAEGDTINTWAEDTLLNIEHFKEFERSHCNLSEEYPASLLGLTSYAVTQKNERTINGLVLKDYKAYSVIPERSIDSFSATPSASVAMLWNGSALLRACSVFVTAVSLWILQFFPF